jgi:hypothetical protein
VIMRPMWEERCDGGYTWCRRADDRGRGSPAFGEQVPSIAS